MESSFLGDLELRYYQSDKILAINWPAFIDIYSKEFREAIVLLFKLIKKVNIIKLLLNTGETIPVNEKFIPEDLLELVRKVLMDVQLQKIARVETTDTLWEINLLQVINYLKQVLNLQFDIAFFPAQENALSWLRAN